MNKFYSFLFLIPFCFVSLLTNAQKDSTHFVFTVKTDHPGSSNDSSYTINTSFNLNFDYDVDWDNDGVFDTLGLTRGITHQYDSAGTYTIRIKGSFPKIDFGGASARVKRDAEKLISINQWGTTQWEELYNAFVFCSNLEYDATDAPDLSKNPPLFGMFSEATKFNGDISNWDVSNIGSFAYMFRGASSFNQDIGNWDVSAAEDMSTMFADATSFNQDIGSWKVDSVKRMFGMFLNATAFNQDIGNWNVSSAIRMYSMFEGASSFNQDISNWDISGRDVTGSTTFIDMFKNASSFDQDLGNWKIDSVSKMSGMFDSSGMSTFNYDNTLIAWQQKAHLDNVFIGVAGLIFCNSDSARAELEKDGWTFSGDSLSNNCVTSLPENPDQNNALSIYPNPSNGVITVHLAEKTSFPQFISIYDSKSALIHRISTTKELNKIDLSRYPSGLYFIHNGSHIEKVMVFR